MFSHDVIQNIKIAASALLKLERHGQKRYKRFDMAAPAVAANIQHQNTRENGLGECTLKLVLHNTADDSRREHDFTLADGRLDLVRVSQVKEHVETKYSIPVCCQTLFFEARKLRDEDTLAESWLREEDIIVVQYDTIASVDYVIELVKKLKQLLPKLEEYMNCPMQHSTAQSLNNFSLGITPHRLRDLIFNCFRDATKQCDANRLMFVHRGGAEVVFKLYKLILKLDYRDSIFHVRYLESMLIQVVGSALIDSSTRLPILRKLVVENPTLDYVLKSFTRVLIPKHQRVVAPVAPQGEQWAVPREVQNQVLAMCLQMSQVNTSNLAEIEEYQLQIASNEEVMRQTFSVALTPTFKFGPSMVAIGTLDNLSSQIDAHVYLTSPEIINSVMAVNRNQLNRPYQSRTRFNLDRLILKSVIATFFSELICHSAPIISFPLKGKIYHFMEDFLKSVEPNVIRQHRDKYGICCVDLLPTVSLPYSPLDPTNPQYTPSHNQMLRRLKQLCIEFGVLCLRYELLGEYQQTSVLENGLLDYIVCLPWIVEGNDKAHHHACKLVAFLREETSIQPPSLLNLATAKLATMHFGLRRILKMSVHEVFTEYHQVLSSS